MAALLHLSCRFSSKVERVSLKLNRFGYRADHSHYARDCLSSLQQILQADR